MFTEPHQSSLSGFYVQCYTNSPYLGVEFLHVSTVMANIDLSKPIIKDVIIAEAEDYWPSRRRSFLTHNRSSCAVEQFRSDASLEVVDRRAPNYSKNWQWTTEGDVSKRRSTPAPHEKPRYSLGAHDGLIRVRRYAGERCLPEYFIELHCGLTPGVIIDDPTCYELRQDNARPHVAKTIQDFCSAQNMQLLPWLAYSPMEHVCDLVDRRLALDPRPAESKDKLLLHIQAIWNSLPQADIQDLFYSMPRRIAARIAVPGGYTKY
ncbi:transposable element Tcb2 transposase [Trichonephila clavipes]|nr:transposable element Tcb2 transposase [Trichonephila clavipes]